MPAKKTTTKKTVKKAAASRKPRAAKAPGTKLTRATKGHSVEQNAKFKKGNFNVTISLNEEEYRASTQDLESALLELNPPTIKTKVLVSVEHNGKVVEKLMFVPQARRVFNNKLGAKFFAINIEKRLEALES